MANIIKHDGIVENINGSHIQVRITQTSACVSCSAKGHCGSSENKDKIIDIYDNNSLSYQKGERVMVYGTTRMGFQAVFIAFAIPFILLVITLFITISVSGGNEVIAALLALAILAPYYLVVYLLRNRIKQKFSFTLKSINNN